VRRAVAAVTALLLAAGCASPVNDAADANTHLSRIYLAAVTNLQHVESNGADEAVMDKLDALKQELSQIDVGSDSCLARKQDQVAQAVKVVSLVTAAYAFQRNGTAAQKADDFARTVIIHISDPGNQPRSTDICYGKGLPEVNMAGQST
jgi:hypothetical protein